MSDASKTVRKRNVFYFGGYEKASAAHQYRRLTRELARFEETWNVRALPGAPETDSDHSVLTWPIVTEAPNWRVDTRFHYCAWNDLIEEDFARPDYRAIPAGIGSLFDFVLTGTAFRYFAVAWRYGLFFSYALVLTALFALAAAAIVWGVARLGVPMPWYLAAPLWLAVFWGLLRWPGDRFHTRYMLNDWSFASAVAWDRRPSYRARLDTFAALFAQTSKAGDADETLIVGHSLGAVLAVESLAAALRRDPELARTAPPITLMTVGSSLLKVGLHPRAQSLRQAVEEVLDAPEVAWIDYTSVVDVLNFYRSDPVRVLKLKAARAPVIRTVKIRAMLGKQIYRRFRYNFLRLHRQFVMGNTMRYHYDFYMSCCGPMAQAARIENPTLSVDNFAEDGTYLPALGEADSPGRAATGG